MTFKRVAYKQLNGRQQENYNFQKLAAHLADFGFNCMWLNDDWQGADFIACHIDGSTFLKVQLKSRLTLDNHKYAGKDIHIAFRDSTDAWYVYPHDVLRDELLADGYLIGSGSWDKHEAYTWPRLSSKLKGILETYAVR